MALAFSAPFKVILAPTFAVLYICTKAETNLPAALSLAVSFCSPNYVTEYL